MKLKKTLLGILGSILIAGSVNAQSIKPVGSISVSYVPSLTLGGVEYDSLMKTEIEIGLKAKLKDLSLLVIGDLSTYISPVSIAYFVPYFQDYGISATLDYKDTLEVFAKHHCFHPVEIDKTYSWGNNIPTDFIAETEIGVKYKF